MTRSQSFSFRRLLGLLSLCAGVLLPSIVTAGSSAGSAPVRPIAEISAFADRVQAELAAQGAHVAIVARMGRDPSVLPDGIRYTHVAFWVYSRITNTDGSTGTGYRVYNLYQTGRNSARSALVQDSPTDFFTPAWSMDAGIIIPDKRLQKKLLSTIASPSYAALHNPQYSVLSNPNSTTFQNCTEHTLDVLMASLHGTSNKARIKANITAHFKAQPVALSDTKRGLAAFASRALTTRDHGDTVATATFGSIARFMQSHRLAKRVYRIDQARVVAF